MNLAKPLAPLPQVLHQHREGANRRRRIGDHQLDPDAMQLFNELLERLDLSCPSLHSDQMATAARELTANSHPRECPKPILQRMRRAGAIDRMLGDREWTVPANSAAVATLVVEYLRDADSLIPNSVPVVGRLDDVIVVEAAWPSIDAELRDYLDFCRLRRIEADLRGEPRRYFGFTRQAWQDAARAETALVDHVHHVDSTSYLSGDARTRFQVH